MKRLLGAILCLAVFHFAVPQAAAKPAKISIKLVADHLVVARGSWGQLHNLNLLLDTGATPSLVHRRVASKLQASGVAQTYTQFRDGIVTDRITAADFRIGTVPVGQVTMLAVNLTHIERECGIPIDAIIGMDVLRLLGKFTIDYNGKFVEIGAALQNGIVVPFDSESSPYIGVLLNANGKALRVILDTGANRINLFESRAGDAVKGLRTVAVNTNVNVAGPYSVREVEMELALNKTVFGDYLVVVFEVSERAFPNFQGLLGPAALGIKRLSIDIERRVVVLQR